MAQTKKKTTASRQSASKKTTPKKQPKKTETAKREKNNVLIQVAPYILAVIAIFLAVCIVIGEGTLGGGLKDIFTGLFSGAAYAVPIFLLIRAYLWKRDVEAGQLYGRNCCTVIVFVCLTMLLHLVGGGMNELSLKTHYSSGKNLVGGGAVGGILGELFFMGFGKVCSIIIITALMVMLTLYVFGVTPKGIYIWIAYHVKFAGEKRAERAEKRKNAPPSKQQIKEEEYLAYLKEKKRLEKEAREAEEEEARAAAVRKRNVTQSATVYKVKRRRLTEIDIPVDDITVTEMPEETHENTSSMVDELANDDFMYDDNSDVVDEKIFDEVMRRTRERIEKGKRTDDIKDMAAAANISEHSETVEPVAISQPKTVTKPLPTPSYDVDDDFVVSDEVAEESIEAGDVLDAVEIAALSIHDRKKHDDDFETDTVKLAMAVNDDEDDDELTLDMADTSNEDSKSQILTGNVEELINKVSEAHSQESLMIKRESMTQNVVLPREEKSITPTAPEYKFPPIELLTEDDGKGQENIKEELQEKAVKLVETLRSFNVKVKIENISRGPTVTRYELTPEPGTKVSSIKNLVDDIALNLATGGVRIEAPIPGKSAVGIEVPNKKQATVHLRTLIETPKFADAKSKLNVCLGEDVAGEPVYLDIAKMPHLLIAGTTGSGKSVCINSIIMSILYKASPEDVKLMLIDPKKVELNIYNGIPHLLVPVISETKKAVGALSWAVGEMERRYGLIEAVGVREISGYNKETANDPDYEYMPRIVIIIDELADFMMTAPADVEQSICRLAQKARAAGMYLILGTQRPSTNVITGLIKANVPSRIAFTVTNQVDSRVILDRVGAENLIGRGDMLYAPVNMLKPIRVQGAFVSENDVEAVVSYIKNMNTGFDTYSESVVNEIERETQKKDIPAKDDNEDPMFSAAVELAIDSGKIATSLIQRKMSVGYGRAAKLIDRMEELGFVSAPDGQKPREVLITKQQYMEMRLNKDID